MITLLLLSLLTSLLLQYYSRTSTFSQRQEKQVTTTEVGKFEKRCGRSADIGLRTEFRVTLAQPDPWMTFLRETYARTYTRRIKHTAPRSCVHFRTHAGSFVADSDTRRGAGCVYARTLVPTLAQLSWIVPLPSSTSFRVNNAGRTTTILSTPIHFPHFSLHHASHTPAWSIRYGDRAVANRIFLSSRDVLSYFVR